ncbi:hypothetical protein NMG60_11036799 [Bertholletia excelsa]
MARSHDAAGGREEVALLGFDSAVNLYICMIFVFLSIVSMVIFACGSSPDDEHHNKKSRGCGGDGGYGGGDCGGGGSCGGGGGGSGGGG